MTSGFSKIVEGRAVSDLSACNNYYEALLGVISNKVLSIKEQLVRLSNPELEKAYDEFMNNVLPGKNTTVSNLLNVADLNADLLNKTSILLQDQSNIPKPKELTEDFLRWHLQKTYNDSEKILLESAITDSSLRSTTRKESLSIRLITNINQPDDYLVFTSNFKQKSSKFYFHQRVIPLDFVSSESSREVESNLIDAISRLNSLSFSMIAMYRYNLISKDLAPPVRNAKLLPSQLETLCVFNAIELAIDPLTSFTLHDLKGFVVDKGLDGYFDTLAIEFFKGDNSSNNLSLDELFNISLALKDFDFENNYKMMYFIIDSFYDKCENSTFFVASLIRHPDLIAQNVFDESYEMEQYYEENKDEVDDLISCLSLSDEICNVLIKQDIVNTSIVIADEDEDIELSYSI
tara:strand:- start:90598 stop:91812 length:1215 start_codon:yes stop_codon:yes gene_type:complete